MRKALLWMIFGGMFAYPIEGLWRIPANGGWVNIAMFPVYGLCFFFVGGVNQLPAFYSLSMRLQAAIGAAICLLVEFAAGYILNIKLGLGIWDYSQMPFNIMGQICVPFGIAWFFLMPFAIWLEDRLNLILHAYKSYYGKLTDSTVLYDYTLSEAYKEFLVGGD